MSARTIQMNEQVYDYFRGVAFRETSLLESLREETAQLPMARMQISPEQGQFLAMLVELMGARKVLEIGSFTGYSALWMASALPSDGKLMACDVSEEWTTIGQRYWKEAGVNDQIELRLAEARKTLEEELLPDQQGTFDLVFIDADKGNYDVYYECSLRLLRPGGLIAIDNVLWGGSVADLDDQKDDTKAIRALNAKIQEDQRVTHCLVPIGDGLTLARKK